MIIIIIIIIIIGARGSSVIIETSLRSEGRGLIPGKGKRFSLLLHSVQTGSGIRTSYPLSTMGCSPAGKVAGA
jgi:hypothetical protein